MSSFCEKFVFKETNDLAQKNYKRNTYIYVYSHVSVKYRKCVLQVTGSLTKGFRTVFKKNVKSNLRFTHKINNTLKFNN